MFPRGHWAEDSQFAAFVRRLGAQVAVGLAGCSGSALTVPPGGHCPPAAGPQSPGKEEVVCERVERAQHLPLIELSSLSVSFGHWCEV